jgi:peroxiredoxin Q/BCP
MGKYAFLFVFAIVAVLACNHASAVNELPAVGAAAPSFNLTTNEGKQVSLGDFKGKWVVLYFYPKDFTSGCTLEARNFQRELEIYTAANAVILGVSFDSA